ncbi:hypothetical protein NW768_010025 [Fusarium equiseti]|uniref:AAA+ ATPase domain-containing protein n=1 Tax=Fusarium equiseti TaxID=61235 RepID=A0ABQ8R2A8_FUSEQ|nr:hypothetical protein NW768_010025 [Fusarium equiseti]
MQVPDTKIRDSAHKPESTETQKFGDTTESHGAPSHYIRSGAGDKRVQDRPPNTETRETMLAALPALRRMIKSADELLEHVEHVQRPENLLMSLGVLSGSVWRETIALLDLDDGEELERPTESCQADRMSHPPITPTSTSLEDRSRPATVVEPDTIADLSKGDYHGVFGDSSNHAQNGSASDVSEPVVIRVDLEESVPAKPARLQEKPITPSQIQAAPNATDDVQIISKDHNSRLSSPQPSTANDDKTEVAQPNWLSKVVRLPGRAFGTRVMEAKHLEDIFAYYEDVPVEQIRQGLENTFTEEETVDQETGRQMMPFMVEIRSKILWEALSEVLPTDWDGRRILTAPYRAVIAYWNDLSNFSTMLQDLINEIDQWINQRESLHGDNELGEDDDVSFEWATLSAKRSDLNRLSQTRSQLETFMSFFRQMMGPSIVIREKLDKGTLQTISFDDLWQLFKVGETLIYNHEGRDTACQVYSLTGGFKDLNLTEYLGIESVLGRGQGDYPRQDDLGPKDQGVPLYPSSMVYHYCSVNQGSSGLDGVSSIVTGVSTPLIVDCFILDYNGTWIGPHQVTLEFQSFVGECAILSLDAYPLRLHESAIDMEKRLIERGKQFTSSTGHWSYDGLTLSGPDVVQGQVYVDFATGYDHIGWPKSRANFGSMGRYIVKPPKHPALKRESIVTDEAMMRRVSNQFASKMDKGLWQQVRPETSMLSDASYLLMSYVLLGYAFQMRRWYFLDIGQVIRIDKSESARASGWEDLVIPPDYRELLIALVESHASRSKGSPSKSKRSTMTNQIDLVRGKGNGLIILLHGPPGSGKTSTAETIAAYTQRPLYPITCGDIGTTVGEIEYNLQRHFDLANHWGCVLLLDEADVFLMKRDWHDITRNSLASVWLRILEYYSGILFITTNRIGVIDEAFKSRIHICLRYPALDLASTTLIWDKLLNKIERDNESKIVKITFERDSILGFAEKHFYSNIETKSTWNGRQIRNAIQSAILLGQYERLRKLRKKGITEEEAELSEKNKHREIELSKKNLIKIASAATDFEQYLVNVRGSDISLARNESVRDDGFSSKSERSQKRYKPLQVGQEERLIGTAPGLFSGNTDGRLGREPSKMRTLEADGSHYGIKHGGDLKGKKPMSYVSDSGSSDY